MSNSTESPRENGGKRRRRSRGGQNRKRNQQQSHGEGRQPRGKSEGAGRPQEFRPGSAGKSRRRPMPAPPKLTWWQKILKAIGLYKEPVRPPRKAQQSREARPPKSNVRNARSDNAAEAAPADETREPRERRDTREPREAREPREPRRRTRSRGEGGGGGDPSSVESSRIYVGNLSYEATEQDLKELFKGIGAVRSVEVVYDRKTHRSKGFGFVEMLHVDEAKKAVEILHDQFFMGREMVVSGAKKKGQDEREDRDDQEISSTAKPVELAPIPEPEPEPEPEATASAEPAAAEVASSDLVTPVVEESIGNPADDPAPAATEPQPEVEADEQPPRQPVG
jgi:hypothetical protein